MIPFKSHVRGLRPNYNKVFLDNQTTNQIDPSIKKWETNLKLLTKTIFTIYTYIINKKKKKYLSSQQTDEVTKHICDLINKWLTHTILRGLFFIFRSAGEKWRRKPYQYFRHKTLMTTWKTILNMTLVMKSYICNNPGELYWTYVLNKHLWNNETPAVRGITYNKYLRIFFSPLYRV